jgi:hypothetical protein
VDVTESIASKRKGRGNIFSAFFKSGHAVETGILFKLTGENF